MTSATTSPTSEATGLVGRRLLVTGAGSGIGAAIARSAAAAGAAVVVNDLDPERARATMADLGTYGTPAFCVPGDVSTPAGASEVVASAIAELGSLDGLVNNVGVVRGGPLNSIDADEWDLVMRIDLSSALFCCQAAYPELVANAGSIVNISSLCALFPAPGAGSYNVAKAALVTLTQQMALEWGRDHIRVNAIAPGIISGTNFSANSNRPEVLQKRQSIVPLGRTGTAGDIAPVVVFLLSQAAAYMTGQVLAVDGGLGIALQTFIPG